MSLTATLKHGQDYYLGNLHFVRGVPTPIDEAQKKHLEQHAKDPLTIEEDGEKKTQWRQKFEFSSGAPAKPQARTRTPPTSAQ